MMLVEWNVTLSTSSSEIFRLLHEPLKSCNTAREANGCRFVLAAFQAGILTRAPSLAGLSNRLSMLSSSAQVRRVSRAHEWLITRAPHKRAFGRIGLLFSLVLTLALSASTTPAQLPAATIVGVVRDQDGKGIAGVKISLSRAGSRAVLAQTKTTNDGQYAFPGLDADAYRIDFSAEGWTERIISNVEVRANGTLEVSVALSQTTAAAGRASEPSIIDREVSWGRLFGKTLFERLPSSRTVWSILESQEPSTVTDVLDTGGLKVGRPALASAHGASWTGTEYLLDGVNVTDPYVPGRPLLYLAFDDIATLDVVTASTPASLGGSGTTLGIETPQLTDDLHGDARLLYSGRQLQSDNVDQRLRDFHFPGPEKLRHLVDLGLDFGATLPFDSMPWPFFASFSTQNLSKSLGGFAVPIDARVYNGLIRVEPISSQRNQLGGLFAIQHAFDSREGADPLVEPDATTRGKNTAYQALINWRRLTSQSSSLSVGFGVTHANTSSGFQPGVEARSTLDLPDGQRTGSAELSTSGSRTRWEVSAGFQTVCLGGGSHSLSLGAEWDGSQITNGWDSVGGVEQLLVERVGAEVVRWNTPAEAHSRVNNFTMFAQDSWSPFTWLRVPVGLRMEIASGDASRANNDIKWTTVEPRAGLVVPMIHDSLVFRASWSRYGHPLQGAYLDYGNPAAIGGEVFRWTDSNHDLQAQPEELGQPIRVFGGPHSEVNKDLSRPFTDEISIGVEHSLRRLVRAHARFFRRDTHRIIRLVNEGLPPSSYDPVSVVDPGNDGIPGTPDDKVLTLYNEKKAALGEDFLVLSHTADGRGSYKGFELGLDIVTSRAELSASFSAMEARAPTNPGNSVFQNDTGVIGSLGTDPNTFLFSNSRTFFDRAYVGKMTGYYDAPLGLKLGAVAKYYDGLPFGRSLFVDGLNQGPLFVRTTPRAQPGGFRTQFNMTLDVGLARQFKLPRGTLSARVDSFNLLNLNQNTVEASLTSPSFEMRVPIAIQSPRNVRLGVEWSF